MSSFRKLLRTQKATGMAAGEAWLAHERAVRAMASESGWRDSEVAMTLASDFDDLRAVYGKRAAKAIEAARAGASSPRLQRALQKGGAPAPAPAEFWFGRYSTSMDGDTFVTVGRTASEVQAALVAHIREHAEVFPEWRWAERVKQTNDDAQLAEFFDVQPEQLAFGSVVSV